MVAVNSLFSELTDTSRGEVNNFIEFMYHKENRDETLAAIKDARNGNTIGPFNTVEEFMADLCA